jgi:hypothetical protein
LNTHRIGTRTICRACVILAAAALGVLLEASAPVRAQEPVLTPSAIQQLRKAGNQRLLAQITKVHGLDGEQAARLRAIFRASAVLGQGNPAITQHPLTREQCVARVAAAKVRYANPRFRQICGHPYMAPIYDPKRQQPEDAGSCIDQFEFPDIPCEYPVVWVKASEAAGICAAEGKRLCDADEWEDACQGTREGPDYPFDLIRDLPLDAALRTMRQLHNRQSAPQMRWSYGPKYQEGICATGSDKSPDCDGGSFSNCGSNTYPAGSFPGCRSPLQVWDLNGNAAEHMNLPLTPEEMSQRGSTTLGYTEMKGSWFVFDTHRVHPDWCRWRAPFWHGSRVLDPHSHANYHLGFRCCSTVQAP